MNDADRELAEILARNPELKVDAPPTKSPPKQKAGGRGSRRNDWEHQEQVKLFNWARARETTVPALRWLFAVPNGGYRPKATAIKMRNEGQKAGVPDVWLPIPKDGWTGLIIEMKIGKNTPTDKQREWLDQLASFGWLATVCYSCEEAQDVIMEYLGIEDMN